MKQKLPIVIVIVVAAVLVTVLALLVSQQHPSTDNRRLKVLATFYPIYDFTRNVGGNRADISIIVPETVDVHDFEPTPSTVHLVATADVLIFNGAGLEPWINALINAADNPKLVVVDTSQGISLIPVPAQFQKENKTVDPHIWLDPILAKQQVQNILNGLIKADNADENYFTANAEAYEVKLDNLNSQIINATTDVQTRYFVTFHEAFAYFAKRYNLVQVPILGPFEEEPTPSDIANVISAVKQYHLLYVGYESLENPAIAQSIASQTNATLVRMDPIEGLTTAEHRAGANYLSLMQQNLEVMTLVLNHVGSS